MTAPGASESDPIVISDAPDVKATQKEKNTRWGPGVNPVAFLSQRKNISKCSLSSFYYDIQTKGDEM